MNLFLKSKKISKYRIKNSILFQDDNVISSDQKGNLIVFSIKENKIKINLIFIKKNLKIFKRNLILFWRKKLFSSQIILAICTL